MSEKKRKILWKVVFVSSLLSPFVLLSFSSGSWKRQNAVGAALHEIMFPFEYAWHSSLRFVRDGWQHYVALHQAAEDNSKLSGEMALLKVKLADYDDQAMEIQRLRDLLGFTQHHERKYVVAEVVGVPRGELFQGLRISKGERDDIELGMPVVTSNGVIGRIVRTGYNYADVQLLIDDNFNLDVLIQRTRVRGVVRGSFNNQNMQLKLNRKTDIRIGDTIITSGIVGAFPKGLPVGHVIGISYETESISQTITVEPWVDYERVEELVVLKTHDKELQKMLETVGRNWFESAIEQGRGG